MDYGAFIKILFGLTKMREFWIVVILACIYYGGINSSSWVRDRMEYAKYDYSPFWDDRVIIPVSKIAMKNPETGIVEESFDVQRLQYLQFPKADDILKEKLFFNTIYKDKESYDLNVAFNKENKAFIDDNDTIMRTIDGSIIYFTYSLKYGANSNPFLKGNEDIFYVFKLDEEDYNSIKDSIKISKSGFYEAYGKKRPSSSLPDNWKDLPLLAVFKNDFSMVEKRNRWLLTEAAKDEVFANGKILSKEEFENRKSIAEKNFFNFKALKSTL